MNPVERLRRDWLCGQWDRAQSALAQAGAAGDEERCARLRDFIAFCEREAARSGRILVATPHGPRFRKANQEGKSAR